MNYVQHKKVCGHVKDNLTTFFFLKKYNFLKLFEFGFKY